MQMCAIKGLFWATLINNIALCWNIDSFHGTATVNIVREVESQSTDRSLWLLTACRRRNGACQQCLVVGKQFRSHDISELFLRPAYFRRLTHLYKDHMSRWVISRNQSVAHFIKSISEPYIGICMKHFCPIFGRCGAPACDDCECMRSAAWVGA